MNIKKFSYRFAEEILQHPYYIDAYTEIIDICNKCPLPVYKNKSKSQPKLDVVQQIINTYFRLAFEEKGWESEPSVTPEEQKDSLRGDFRKVFSIIDKETGEIKEISIQIEVEMGNAASSYRNYFKFQLSYAYKLSNIGILVLPCDILSRRIDSGLSSFEKTVREIPSADLSITTPIFVIGLDDAGENGIDIKALCSNLEIVKGAKEKYKEAHNELVNHVMKVKND